MRTGCNDIEVQRIDGTWERLGDRAWQVSAVIRPAPHVFEHVAPRYSRCRFCGLVTLEPSTKETE